MSQENVDRFVQAVGAFNCSDIPGVVRVMDPEVQFEHRVAALQGEYSGHDRRPPWTPQRSRGAHGDAANFTYEIELRPTGASRMLRPVLGGMVRSGLRKDLEKLRALLED